MEPEIAPQGSEDAEVHVPEEIPGALPENAGRHQGDPGVPRDKGVTRMPEATADALREEEE